MQSFQSIRDFCSQHHIPAISTATQDFLGQLVIDHKPRVCVEIGSAVGYSSIYMSSIMADRWGQIYSFEVSYRDYLRAVTYAHQMHAYNLTLYPFSILDIEPKLYIPTMVDMIFIDAQKSHYADYLTALEWCIQPKTVVVCDDVIQFHNKLSPLYTYLEKKQIHYEIFNLSDGDGVMVMGL